MIILVQGSKGEAGEYTGLSTLTMPEPFLNNQFVGNQPCDMLIGSCACGETHTESEWVLVRR